MGGRRTASRRADGAGPWHIRGPCGNLHGTSVHAGVAVKKTSIGFYAACVLAAVALAGCSSPNAAWNKASSQNTAAAYQGFIQHYPNDPRVQQARNRIHALKDGQAWSAAKSAGTVQAYQQYLQQYPDGAHAADAQGAVTKLEQGTAWQSAQSANTVVAYQAFLQKYPSAPQAGQAQAKIDTLAPYQLLFARYRSAAVAQTVAQRLKKKFADVVADVLVLPPAGKSKLTEVRSSQMSKSAARAACLKVRRARQPCSVVKIRASSGGLSTL